MNTIIITGYYQGIGKAVYNLFKEESSFKRNIIGVDIKSDYSEIRHEINSNEILYKGNTKDVIIEDKDLKGEITLINNAGVQNNNDIENNLVATIDFTERLIEQVERLGLKFKSILFNTSASSLTGFEFPRYAASKAGLNAYMKNVACRVAPGATCNAIAFGGVLTELNAPVINNEESWNEIMDVTPLKKWMTPNEAANWIYFLTEVNTFASGQVFLVDGGEKDLNNTFVW